MSEKRKSTISSYRKGERILILHRDVDFEFGYVVAVGVTMDHVMGKIPDWDGPREYSLEDWRDGAFIGEARFNIQGELSDWSKDDLRE